MIRVAIIGCLTGFDVNEVKVTIHGCNEFFGFFVKDSEPDYEKSFRQKMSFYVKILNLFLYQHSL
jgi:hypothetical protein